MKFRIERDVLAEAVGWVARGVSSRPPMPVLAGVKLSATTEEGGNLTLASFDYELSARVAVSAEVEIAGEALVTGKLLTEIAKHLPARPVEVSLDGSKIVITCGSSTFSLPAMALDDYPQLPSLPPVAGTVDATTLAEAVTQVAAAAANDETLPKLTGVMAEFNGDQLTLLATDRYRLAVREITWTPAEPGFQGAALVRARTLSDLVKTFSHDQPVSVNMSDSGDIIGFADVGRQTTTLLIEGDYPAIRKLLPTESEVEAVVSVPALVEAVRRVALVVERNDSVHVTFSDGQAVLTAGNADEARAVEVVEAQVTGPDIAVAFNPGYLTDGLKALSTPYVRVLMTQSTKPVLFKGQRELDGQPNSDFQYLLVPIRFAA